MLAHTCDNAEIIKFGEFSNIDFKDPTASKEGRVKRVRTRQTDWIDSQKSHNIPSRTESLLLFNCPNFSARYCLVRSMFSKTVSLLKRICSLMRIFLLSNDKFVELFAGCFNFPTLSFFFTKSFCFVFFTLPMNTFMLRAKKENLRSGFKNLGKIDVLHVLS